MQPPGGKYRYEEIVTRMLSGLREEGTLTDVNPGSVIRTLVEAFSLELAEAHARLATIYEMGYIDTATGESLDFLVALLGQRRIDGLQVVGDALFTRDARVNGRVVIPEGSRLKVKIQPMGGALYKTAREAELEAGQSAVTVPIIADPEEGQEPSAHILPEGLQWDVAQEVPLAGIGGVSIPRPTAQRGYRESDEDLRRRVKGLIDAAGGGTLKAMERAVLATGHATGIQFRDAASDGLPKLLPGQLEAVVDGDLASPVAFQEIQDALNRAKGPGILVQIRGIITRKIAVKLTVLPATPDLSAPKKQALRRAIEQTVQGAIVGLKVGERLLWNPLQAKLLSLDGALDILDGSVVIDGVEGPLSREIPADGLAATARLVLPESGQAIAVKFAGESTLQVRLWATVTPDPTAQAAIARAIEELLAAKGELIGPVSLTYEEVVAAAKGAPGGTSLAAATLVVQILDLAGGGERILTPGAAPHQLGAEERLEAYPAGPVWGALP